VTNEVFEDAQTLESLQEQVGQSRQKLERHAEALRAVEAELDALSLQRQQHELLGTACDSLDELAGLGGADLFWGTPAEAARGAEFVRTVRERGQGFRDQLAEIDGRRRAIIDEIRRDQAGLELLEDDLYDAQEQEERRKLEWIVEREISALANRAERMPWTRGGEDDRRLNKSLSMSMLVCLVLALVLSMVDLPLPERAELAEVPERLARLVQQERARAVLPPVETVVEQREVEPEPPKPPEPEPITEPQPTRNVTDQPPAQAPTQVAAAPQQAVPQPRPEKVGILAFKDKLSNLADNKPAAKLGSSARISGSGDKAVTRTERSMVSTQGPGSSGGINLAALSRDVGGGGAGGQIGGVQITQAESSIGGGVAGGDRPLSGGPGMTRTDEEIQIVFDRHKAALYRLYNRELRNDPTLRGQMVLRLTIEPDGRVSLCGLEATDMNAPELSAQIVGRVKTFDFGAKEGIPPVTILYPIDFLPAA